MFRLSLLHGIPSSVLGLSIVSLVVMMGSSMVTPSLTLYAKDLGAGEFLVGAVVAGFAIGRLIFDIPSGFLTGRAGITRSMIIGLGVLAGASFLAGYAPSLWILFVARLLEGIGSSIYVSAAITYVLISSDSVGRRTSMGAYQSIIMTGPIIGPVVGAPIAVLAGYGAPYFAFAAMIIAAIPVTLAISHKLKTPKVPDEEQERQAEKSTYLNSASLATFGFTFLRSGIYVTAMPLFAYQSLSASVFEVGLILTVASLANLITAFVSGRLTTRYGLQRSLVAVIFLSAALVAAIPFVTTWIVLVAIMALVGAASGFFGQSVAWAADQIEEKVRGIRTKTQSKNTGALAGMHSQVAKGMGVNRTIADMGLVVGPLFVGYMISAFSGSQIMWAASFGASAAVIAGAALFLLASGKRQRISIE
jgi:MFS transporter, DHA1 family, multidrug resistance protein